MFQTQEVLRIQNIRLKSLRCIYEALKNITRFFYSKTVMELCYKISQPTVVKIISKKQYFLRLNLG